MSGLTVTYGTINTISPSYSTDSVQVTEADKTRCVFAFRDTGDSDAGKAILYQNAITYGGDWFGIAQQSVTNADCIIRLLSGVANGLEDLVINSVYYVQDDGSITTNVVSGRKIGIAIASDKLLITEANA
jgi:hypothetical protein